MSDLHKVIPKVGGQVQESKVKSPKGLDSSLWGVEYFYEPRSDLTDYCKLSSNMPAS